MSSDRNYLEQEVIERAKHVTAESVRTTCSFARAERLLGREYHGRFLIELLQNAADASRGSGTASGRARVVVQIAHGPALLVANEGAPMGAEVVIESLGHIGASTKAEGEAIGHKGIGFKSVLELSLTPEIYSGLQQSSPALAVGFDPERAKEKIRKFSPRWDEWLNDVQGLDRKDPYAAVPVLRFPYWVEELPAEVGDLKRRGFDTVVRLPFDKHFAGQLGFSVDTWLETVRAAVGDVSDQILLLLGCFGEVLLEDHLTHSYEVITQELQGPPVQTDRGVSREVVRVLRSGRLSSRWRLFRRALPDLPHLVGEVAVGIRVDESPDVETVLPAVDGQLSAPFHLFFPTLIPSGLPFLLHAYFEVNAARTDFYRGSAERNQAMLHELAELVRVAVTDAVEDEGLDLVSLVNLVAEAGEPEKPLARDFRRKALDLLDVTDWIPLRNGNEGVRSDRPARVFGARADLIRRIGDTFPSSYIRQRTHLGLPNSGLSDAALELLMDRHPSDARDLWDTMKLLCLPGDYPPWDGSSADRGFRSLIDLLEALEVENREATLELLDTLRKDPRSRLIPTVGAESSRVLLRIPDPSERVPGQRSQLVMARVRSSDGGPLMPPADLDVAFLPDGLLSSEAELDRAKPLGVRPFTVDNVLDRLSGIDDAQVDGEALVRFLWQLLAREGVSGFSMRRSVERASVFDPSRWFWCRPGRGREDETARLRQQRERYLASVPLPCRDGAWRQAGRIAFGADWADWLEGRTGRHSASVVQDRIAAYRAMEQVSPGSEALLAPPEKVLPLLDGNVFHDGSLVDRDETIDEELDGWQRDARRHAFLLRLGVWEVPPIEAYESQDRNRSRFPWEGPVANKQRELVEQGGGWRFGLHGWAGRQHHNVYLAEDYRFLWPLEEMAQRDVASLVAGLRFGAKLYGERMNALVFCQTCRDGAGSHTARRHSSGDDGFPSSLAVQLRNGHWVPYTLDGEPKAPLPPRSTWWHPKPPSGAALRQSPWRFVPLCRPDEGMNEDLRRLAGIPTLDDANADAVGSLLLELRAQFEDGRLPIDPATSGSARQAFVGLHRLAYERLSELSSEQAGQGAVLDRTGVLCELGEGLVYRHPNEARHDDGRFATYVRHFVGSIPFAVFPRDRETVASRLGVAPFRLHLTRRGADDGLDVTDEVRDFHGDRIAELLSIMVHHSLGAQTLDVASEQFEQRARRIRNLQIKQLEDLIVDAVVEDTTNPEDSTIHVTLGEGSGQDLFLDKPTSGSPVLFHDLSGDGWQDRLRRKIAPYLARVLENPAYAHTFALFLQAENDAEREEFLLELGISADEVDAIKARLGIVSEEEHQRHLRWFRAILDVLGAEPLESAFDAEQLAFRLKSTNLPAHVADRLVELGGGEEVRRETDQDSALRLLAGAGVDLKLLHSKLLEARDSGLTVKVARRAFSRWISANGQRLSAVLATKFSSDEAKSKVRSLEPPADLILSIDPALPALLSPVVDALREAGLTSDAQTLADNPAQALARLGGFGTVEDLDSNVALLFNEEERQRHLREFAAQWRREVRLLAILARTGPAETRSTIRSHAEAVTTILPDNPSAPQDLQDALSELFAGHTELARKIAVRLAESVDLPDRSLLMEWAKQDGIAVDRLSSVERALEAPRREHARELHKRAQRLAQRGVRPVPPRGFADIPPRQPEKRQGEVKTIKIEPGHERQKRKLGDEGERWALAAVVGSLMQLDKQTRDAAIDEIEALLGRFEGAPVDKALAYAASARMPDLDDEERIDELSNLLHVSQHSDAFGFDLVGWLPSNSSGEGRAIYLEVKSSGGQGFHLSQGQWSLAKHLHKERRGDQYAVLVIRRAKGGGVPAAMDLLPDPVGLAKAKHLRREADGYQITYRTSK